jgi:small-conductance mechanosensitive channel
MVERYSLAARLDLVRDNLAALVAALPRFPDEIARAGETLSREIASYGIERVLLLVMCFVALGIGFEILFHYATAATRRQIAGRGSATVTGRLRDVSLQVGCNLGRLIAFSLGSIVTVLAFAWPPLTREIMLGLLIVFVVVRLSRYVVFAPPWRTRAALFFGWLTFGLVCVSLLDTLEVPSDIRRLSANLLALGLLVIALEAAWHRLARNGAWMLSGYLLFLWLLWAMPATPERPLFWTCVVVGVLPAAIAAIRHIAAGHAGLVVVSIERGLRAALIIGALVFLAYVWGIPLGELTVSDTPITRALRGVLSAIVIVLVADCSWQLIKAAFHRALQGAMEPGEWDDEETRRRQRLRTLLPIVGNVVFIVLAVMAVLMVLAALGVEIGPLIAGAGVVGVAVGFGAQTIVKDIISGIFYLLDDAFRVGEYIQASKYKGTVESFSLRSIKLRHHRGPLTTVPFGELGAVENMSRDWVIDKLTIGVTYDTDLDAAKKIIKEIGKELAADPEFQGKLIETLKMQGVEQFGDFAIQLRLKLKAKPGEQFVIRRRAYALIKKAFDANGIKFAFPTVQVAGGQDVAAVAAKRGLELVGAEEERA